MTLRSALAAAALAAAALLAPAAAEAACSLKTIDVPVEMQGLRPIVTAKIGGAPVKLLLDSGSFYNMLDSKFVAEHNLRPAGRTVLGSRFKEAAATVVTGVGGRQVASQIVTVPEVEFVGAKLPSQVFLSMPTAGEGETSGLLGQNFLHQLDDEYDLKNGKLKLVQATDCRGLGLAYWTQPNQTYSAAPIDRANGLNKRTATTVLINGQNMHAIFDTGSPTTFITRRAAARAGVETTATGVKEAGYTSGLDRDHIKTWIAPFASVKIGDEEIKNGLLRIGQTDAQDFDVLIGADFFLAHHVYVANSQDMIYFTYSGGPVFNVQAGDVEETAPGK